MEVTDKHRKLAASAVRQFGPEFLHGTFESAIERIAAMLAKELPDHSAAVRKLRAACQAVADHLVKTFPPYPKGKSPTQICRRALEETEEFDKCYTT